MKMLSKIKKLIPTPIKEKLLPLKIRFIDNPKKKKLAIQMQKKHQQLLQEVKGKQKIRVIFLAIHKSVWKVDPVFRKMLEDSFFEPIVLICPYTVYGEERMWEDMNEAFDYFKNKGYPLMSSYDNDKKEWLKLDDLKPDIVFFTNPHKLTRKEYYEDAYLNYLSCYVPYFFMATRHDGDEKYQLNTDFFICLWKIFWPNLYIDEKYKQVTLKSKTNAKCFGYPGVEYLLENNRTSIAWKRLNHNRKKIIYAPHHTIENTNRSLSSFLIFGEYIKKLVIKHSDYIQWSFKPHPILKSKLYEHPDWGKLKTDKYYEFWQKNDFTQLDDGEYFDLFNESDAIIHDCSSFIVEYAFVKKPCLYLSYNDNYRNLLNDFGKQVIKIYTIGKTINEIEEFIQQIIDETKDINIENRRYFDNYFDRFYKNNLPSQRIMQDIKRSLKPGEWKTL